MKKITRFVAAALVAICLTSPASWAWLLQRPPSSPCLAGLGDRGVTYTFYWGVRAYDFAYALAGGQAFNIIRASDSVTCDLVYNGTGNLFALVTASCSGGGGANGQIPSTFCNGTTCKPVTIYQQRGGTACTGSTPCNFTQGTDASRFTLDFSCGKSPFCVKVTTGKSMATPSYTPPSAVATLNAVGQRNTSVSFVDWLRDVGLNNTVWAATTTGGWAASVNGQTLACNSPCAPETAFHAAVLTLDGANTAYTVDNTTVTVNRAGGTSASTIKIDMSTGTTVGWWMEASYIASTGQDATARAATITNQRECWAF
jgi:hypothetical protein